MFATWLTFFSAMVYASSNWDRMSWDWDDWYQDLFTQEELTQEISEIEALKDEIIFQKDFEITDLKKDLEEQEEVVNKLNETIVLLPGAAESVWDTMLWDQGNWFIEFDTIASGVDLEEAISEARSLENPNRYFLVNAIDVIAYEEGIKNAFADKDGDGLTDEQELARGTDPNRYSIELKSGWNLISLARVPDNNATGHILGNQALGTVWIWEDKKFKVATELLPLRGHWVYAMTNTNVDIQLSLNE